MKLARLQRGYNLVELMIGMLLSGIVLVGLVQIFVSSRQSFANSIDRHSLQQRGQFALQFISKEIRQAGFSPDPWQRTAPSPIGPASSDHQDGSDLLEMQ